MASKSYKRPESVLVVVSTAAGAVLLLERRSPPGFWQSVTGSLQPRETPAAAAQRELREETGMETEGRLEDCHTTNRFRIRPEWRARYAPDVGYNTEHVFRLLLPGRLEVRLNPEEHIAYDWVDRGRAAARVASETNRDAILRYVPQPAG